MNMLFVVLILLAAVAVFSIQNAQTVPIKFLVWGAEASLAIVIIVSVALGALLASVVALWTNIKRSRGAKKKSASAGKSDAATRSDEQLGKPSDMSASK